MAHRVPRFAGNDITGRAVRMTELAHKINISAHHAPCDQRQFICWNASKGAIDRFNEYFRSTKLLTVGDKVALNCEIAASRRTTFTAVTRKTIVMRLGNSAGEFAMRHSAGP